jgi:ATP-dependent exoDNAse (exonuclease V) beta subunit
MSSKSQNTILAQYNMHPRDASIKFYERGHKYEIRHDPKSKYTSVTTWVHSNFPKFDADAIIDSMMKSKSWGPEHKYWGQTPSQIKAGWTNNGAAVSQAGTDLHYEIECFMNNPKIKQNYTHAELLEYYQEEIEKNKTKEIEWEYFINFVKEHPQLKPYRTEWMVYDEDSKIAGSIDMIYENPDGTLSIYDWKRSKEINTTNPYNKFALTDCICHIPDTNFWHYSLQLNTYKTILETKYNKQIKDLFLVRIHPNNEENTYELMSVPILKKEMQDLFDMRKQMFIKKT